MVGPELPDAELDELVTRGLRSYARYWMEAFRLPVADAATQILAGFRLDGAELLAADVAAGRGAVVALPHAGNWDAAGAWVAATGWPLTTVAERLKPEGLYQRFLAFREALGMEILPTHRRAAAAVRRARRPAARRRTWCRCWPTGTCPPAGSRWSSSAAGPGCRPARRCSRCAPARRSTWPRCGTNRTRPARRLAGPLPVPDPDGGTAGRAGPALTQQIADRLAAGIAQHPADWHMLQRMWLDQARSGDGRRRRSPSAAGPA